jgi:hypothetical protein
LKQSTRRPSRRGLLVGGKSTSNGPHLVIGITAREAETSCSMPMRMLRSSQRGLGVLGSEGSEALAFWYWKKELGYGIPRDRRFWFGFCVIVPCGLSRIVWWTLCAIFSGGFLYNKLDIRTALIESRTRPGHPLMLAKGNCVLHNFKYLLLEVKCARDLNERCFRPHLRESPFLTRKTMTAPPTCLLQASPTHGCPDFWSSGLLLARYSQV